MLEIFILKVRSQDAIFGLSVSKEGRETAWIWLQVDLLCTKRYLNSLQNVGWIDLYFIVCLFFEGRFIVFFFRVDLWFVLFKYIDW